MSRAVTIELSDKTYSQLQQVAELAQVSVDSIIEQSLTYSLFPLLEEIPPAYQAELYPLLSMTEAELQAEARRRFGSEQWAEYETLLDKKKETALTAGERMRLDALRHEADVLTLRKAYAAVLLKRLGRPVPSLADLESF